MKCTKYFVFDSKTRFNFKHFISEPDFCDTPVDLCLIMDSSGSIRDHNPPGGQPDNWQLILQFLASVVRAFNIGPDATHVGAIVFSEDVIFEFSLSQYDNMDAVVEALLDIQYLGQTSNTPEALKIARTQCFNITHGDRPNVDNLAIIVTDGVPFPPFRREPALEEAKALRNSGAAVISVGITDNIDVDFLKDMSSLPQLEGQNYIAVKDFNALSSIRKFVVRGSCDTIESKYIYS